MATKPQPKRRKVQKRTKEGKPLQHVQWQALAVENLTPLFRRQHVIGTNIMVARVQLKKGCLVPEHHHFHEQVSCVMQGAIKFWIDGREIVVRAGEVLAIPPHMPHRVEALEDTLAFDLFSPPRQDWLDGTDDYLRGK
jgi:quercetin dioxygenase-like cupin family protein